MPKTQRPQVTLPYGEVAFASLNKAKSFQEGEKAKFAVTLIYSQANVDKAIEQIAKALRAADPALTEKAAIKLASKNGKGADRFTEDGEDSGRFKFSASQAEEIHNAKGELIATFEVPCLDSKGERYATVPRVGKGTIASPIVELSVFSGGMVFRLKAVVIKKLVEFGSGNDLGEFVAPENDNDFPDAYAADQSF